MNFSVFAARRAACWIIAVSACLAVGLMVLGCGGETGGFASGVGGTLVDGAQRHTAIRIEWVGSSSVAKATQGEAKPVFAPVDAETAVVQMPGAGYQGSDVTFDAVQLNPTKDLTLPAYNGKIQVLEGGKPVWPKLFDMGTDRTVFVSFFNHSGNRVGIAQFKGTYKKVGVETVLTDHVSEPGPGVPIKTEDGSTAVVLLTLKNLPRVFGTSLEVRALDVSVTPNREYIKRIPLLDSNGQSLVANDGSLDSSMIVVDRGGDLKFSLYVYSGEKGQGAQLNDETGTQTIGTQEIIGNVPTNTVITLTGVPDSETQLVNPAGDPTLLVGNSFVPQIYVEDRYQIRTPLKVTADLSTPGDHRKKLIFQLKQTDPTLADTTYQGGIPGEDTGAYFAQQVGDANIWVSAMSDSGYVANPGDPTVLPALTLATKVTVSIPPSQLQITNLDDDNKLKVGYSIDPATATPVAINLVLAPVGGGNGVSINRPYSTTGNLPHVEIVEVDANGDPTTPYAAIAGPGTNIAQGKFVGQHPTGVNFPEPRLKITYTGNEGTYSTILTIKVVGGSGSGGIH